jgi:hypothetical protein
MSKCIAQLMLHMLTALGPSYSIILKLDHKVHKFLVPEDTLTAV